MSDFENNFLLPLIHVELATEVLTKIIKSEITRIGLKRAVIGISGGIDSALALALTVKALGAQNVKGVLMPYKTSSPQSLEHGRLVCEEYGVNYTVEEITPMATPLFERDSEITAKRKGNILARLRMVVLYDYSAREGALVIGTGNKSEILLGYSTIWGDSACAINPLGDLYKCQVRQLSAYLNVPAVIINKPPSADLWQGQSDEAELNLTYDFIDRILYQYIDLCRSKEWLREQMQLGGDGPALERIFKLIETSSFKRNMPVIAKLSQRTVNREFSLPRDLYT